MTLASDFNRIDCSETAPCEGDINGDGAVNADDLTLFAAEFGRTDCPLDEFYYFHNDHLGTPQRITDQTGTIVWSANYMPFGEAIITTNTITNPFRFPGQYYDQETGLHYNYFRYYDPGIGRYLRVDPIGPNAVYTPYIYTEDNPVIKMDFVGLLCACDADCPSGSYIFSGWQYGGFLFFAGITFKHLIFKCVDSDDTFDLLIQSINFGGGLGSSLLIPAGIAAGCNKKDVIANMTGWSVFVNVFPPGIPTKPSLGIGGEVSTNPVAGNTPQIVSNAALPPGYGLEVSAGGSYSWTVR